MKKEIKMRKVFKLFVIVLVASLGFSGCASLIKSFTNPDPLGTIVVNNVEWAGVNVDVVWNLASSPNKLTHFYQWGGSSGGHNPTSPGDGIPVTNWKSEVTDSKWATSVCPIGWRMPTMAEMKALLTSGYTWAEANTRGNTIAGMFFGTRNKSAMLPDDMEGAIFLPACGYRNNIDGSLMEQGTIGRYMTSEAVNSTEAYYLTISNGKALIEELPKATGATIRVVRSQ